MNLIHKYRENEGINVWKNNNIIIHRPTVRPQDASGRPQNLLTEPMVRPHKTVHGRKDWYD